MASKRLFISYSSEDKTFASKLRAMLQKRGALVFSDAELDLGRPWPEQLRKQIQEASALVLVVPSPSVPNRNNIWFEAGAAKAFGKRILAVLPPKRGGIRDLPTELADLLVLDADERPLESVADTLLQAA
jgi:hypothetical protein